MILRFSPLPLPGCRFRYATRSDTAYAMLPRLRHIFIDAAAAIAAADYAIFAISRR